MENKLAIGINLTNLNELFNLIREVEVQSKGKEFNNALKTKIKLVRDKINELSNDELRVLSFELMKTDSTKLFLGICFQSLDDSDLSLLLTEIKVLEYRLYQKYHKGILQTLRNRSTDSLWDKVSYLSLDD